jgi:hypothetical protein
MISHVRLIGRLAHLSELRLLIALVTRAKFFGHFPLPTIKHNVAFMCNIPNFKMYVVAGDGIQLRFKCVYSA